MEILPYQLREIYENTYQIVDPGIGIGSVMLYLLVGSERALLIDSGYGLLNLREIVRQVTDKDVVCACTHGHIDHALGAWQFEKAYMHSRDGEVFLRHTDPAMIRSVGFAPPSPLVPPDPIRESSHHSAWVEQMCSLERPMPLPMEDIPFFDLGGRRVSWRLLPGHTQGSVVFLDEKYHTVFDADAAPPGVWLFLPESSPLPEYIENLKEYRDYLLEHGIVHRYAGHSQEALSLVDLDKLLACCRLVTPEGGIPMPTPFGKSRIFMEEGSAVFAAE